MERFGRFVRQKKFILDYAAGIKGVAEACREFGVPRSSFYRWKSAYAAGGAAGAIVDFGCLAVALKSQHQQVLRFGAERDGSTLSGLDLHRSTVSRATVVAWCRSGKEVDLIQEGGPDLTQATDQVTVRREASPRKECLELLNDLVEPTHNSWNPGGRIGWFRHFALISLACYLYVVK